MSISGSPHETVFQFPSRRALKQKQHNTLTAKLQAALAREQRLIREKRELSKRQVMLAQEFEHRLVNSMQLITSLLSSQSRRAKTAEAAGQLTIAANRVAALGRVHRRLHLVDRTFPVCSIIRPTETEGAAMGALQFLTRTGLFIGQSQSFFTFMTQLAQAADAA